MTQCFMSTLHGLKNPESKNFTINYISSNTYEAVKTVPP